MKQFWQSPASCLWGVASMTLVFATSCSSSDDMSNLSLSVFVQSVGCSNYEESVDFAPFVKEWGYCEFNDDKIQVYAFTDKKAQNSFLETVTDFGVVVENLVIEELFILAPNGSEDRDNLRTAIDNL